MQEESVETSGEIIQFVTFELADEIYCADLDAVQEVIRVAEITGVPRAQEFIEGVINLRGFVIPVVDLGKRFGIGSVEHSKSARIIILEIEESIVGMMVDAVLDVVSVDTEHIEQPSPIIKHSVATDYLDGFFELNDKLAKVLNLEKIFSAGELVSLREMEDSPEEDGGAG